MLAVIAMGSIVLDPPDMAVNVGGEIQNCFKWDVNLKNFDVEVLIQIHDNQVKFLLPLNREALFRRNISHFGYTTLKSTICYGMLRTAHPCPGEVVCDPMCGSGAILVEAVLEWRGVLVLGGDSDVGSVEKTAMNLTALPPGEIASVVDVMPWDATNLPVGSDLIDCIISDLPFGKRMGTKCNNRKLYPALLREWARVARRGTGRAVLLTQDKKSLQDAIYMCHNLWKKYCYHYVNVGNLDAAVFCLKRTGVKA